MTPINYLYAFIGGLIFGGINSWYWYRNGYRGGKLFLWEQLHFWSDHVNFEIVQSKIMITLKYHLYALKRSLILLRKKQFFVFFIPGVVIALIFFTYLLTVGAIGNVVELVSYTPWIGSYMGTAVDSVFDWVNSISIFVYQFTLITLLSPFLTVLSQRVETHETGKIFQSNRVKFINDILRTIGVAIVGGFIYFSLFLLWTFLAWIFGLSFLSPIVSAILIAFLLDLTVMIIH